MAPEFPPRLVILDLRRDGDELRAEVEVVEVEHPASRLRVRWEATAVPDGFEPAGGGVIFVQHAPGLGRHRYQALVPSLGDDTWRWHHGVPSGYEWLMLIVMAPAGSTFASSQPPPVSAKAHGDRAALYWILKGDAEGRTDLQFTLAPGAAPSSRDLERLNRLGLVPGGDTGVEVAPPTSLATAPAAFVSYSHDSPAHDEWVLRLSQRLRADGVSATLDRYVNGTPAEGWPRWMLNEIYRARFVLVVCTGTYYRRFRGHEAPGSGRGVDWEGLLITQEMYDARGGTTRFVPIVRSADDERFIPEMLRGHTRYVLSSDAAYQALLDFLLGQAGVAPAPLGDAQRRPRAQAAPLARVGAHAPPRHVSAATVAAFVGVTDRGPVVATAVRDLVEYRAVFGEPLPPGVSFLGPALRGFFASGGTEALVVRVVPPSASVAQASVERDGHVLMVAATSAGVWGNEVEVAIGPGARTGLRVTVTRGAEREEYDNLSVRPGGPNPFVSTVNGRSRLVHVWWAWATPQSEVALAAQVRLVHGCGGLPLGVAEFTRALAALDAIDDCELLCVPDHVHPVLDEVTRDQVTDAIVAWCGARGDCLALLATPPGKTGDELRPRHDVDHAALFHPWLREHGVAIPPIGHVAGAYARSDRERGRQAPPVGLGLEGGDQPPFAAVVDREAREQLLRFGLNVLELDASGRTPQLTSASTLAIDERSRSISGTRLVRFLGRWLERSLAWTVFEPSVPAVWRRVEDTLGAFLHDLWEDGVLLGATAHEAFFVRCDESTMTDDDRANGRLIAVIGLVAAGAPASALRVALRSLPTATDQG